MREHLGFLKASSAVVKVAAWIFLFFGVLGGIAMILGISPSNLGIFPDNPRLDGFIVLTLNAFLFFFLFLIAKVADLLILVINEIKKE
ncbi:MAG: hypothetical protein M0R66_03365 [Candidatus Omnitrophica bacterium]|nr:hypothetical protein [Candidatus Omnitrophota bacterium]MDD5166359.1 hypothetical protein [Candidatus Omnitrophota bacterium]